MEEPDIQKPQKQKGPVARKRRSRWGWVVGHACAIMGVCLLVGGCVMFSMPGKSFRGTLPPATPEIKTLAADLEKHVRVLAEQIGDRNMSQFDKLEEAAKYVEGQLAATGIQPQSLPYELNGLRPRNIELELPGGGPHAGEIVVVGAHYDSVRSPGGCPAANDNGSGVAALLELARAFKSRPHDRTLRFVAFVNEEPPWFQTERMGSLVYAKHCRESGDNIAGALVMDTIGCYNDDAGSQRYPLGILKAFYPTRGDFIALIGNIGSRSLVRGCVGSFRANAQFPCEGIAAPESIPGIGFSDHWSFWRAGYPALMITDTAMFRYLHYHSAQDTPEKIDYDRVARVVAGLVPVVDNFANPKKAETAE